MWLVTAITGWTVGVIGVLVVTAADVPDAETAAVDWLIVIVITSFVPGTDTVMVVGLATGAVIEVTAWLLPAIVCAAGAMFPCVVAAVATAVLPLIAVVPVVLPATFLTLVAPLISHRCREPFADFTSSQCLVAKTTTPRCAAKVVCLIWAVAKVRIGAIWVSTVSALDCEEFQLVSAVLRAVASLIWWCLGEFQ
jgi:hypothetical protein